jgi:hypothetical protein
MFTGKPPDLWAHDDPRHRVMPEINGAADFAE